MLNGKVFCLLLFIAWQLTDAARLPIFELARERGHDSTQQLPSETQQQENVEPARARVREGVPPPLCAGRVCAAPPAGPVCAFDAAGTARTFKTICELEAVSCRESTLYAITSLGEC